MEDIEVDGINIGCVYVSMKYYLADFLNSLVGFHRRSIFRYVRQLTFNHQYALAHNRVEFYIFDYLGAFKFGNYPPGGLFILRGVRLIFSTLMAVCISSKSMPSAFASAGGGVSPVSSLTE